MLVQKAVLSRIPSLAELSQEITLEDDESYMYVSRLKQPLKNSFQWSFVHC